ncbi:MAG TPA: ATPase domain-containing protein, partial [Polyangiales bacterium]|nr:ATPase domain-containing protein [Polyangiales bacterium]
PERQGRLHFFASRPTSQGLESHLALMLHLIDRHQPSTVVVDPVTSLTQSSSDEDAHLMIVRLIDFLKMRGITALLTSLTAGEAATDEATLVAVSSLVDTWLLVRAREVNGERNRTLYVLKSRGMDHSNQVREFIITSSGVDLVDVYIGAGGVLTGSARAQQEVRERAEVLLRRQEVARLQRQREAKKRALESHIAALRAEFERDNAELDLSIGEAEQRASQLVSDRRTMADRRGQEETRKPRRAGTRERQRA